MIQRKYFENNANILIDCQTHLDATKIGLALAHGAQAAGEGAGGGAGGQSTVQISGWIQAEVRATTARHRNRTFMVLMIDMCCFFLQVANANVLVLKPCGSFYILLSIIHITNYDFKLTLNLICTASSLSPFTFVLSDLSDVHA